MPLNWAIKNYMYLLILYVCTNSCGMNYKSGFSPSVMWMPGIKFRLPGFMEMPFLLGHLACPYNFNITMSF